MTRNLYTIRGKVESIIAANTAEEALEVFYDQRHECDEAEVIHEERNEPEYEH